MSTTTAAPPIEQAGLSHIEAEVYFQTTLYVYQAEKLEEEPTRVEYEKLAQLFARLARMRRASEAREELHDPFVLPWLERIVEIFALDRKEARVATEGGCDERARFRAAGDLIIACEGLIERAKAYEPVLCSLCDGPATHQSAEGDPKCERCARYSHTHDLGESFAVSEMIQSFADLMEHVGIDKAQLSDAFENVAVGVEGRVGAFADYARRVQHDREEGRDGLAESDAWRYAWSPIPGVPVSDGDAR